MGSHFENRLITKANSILTSLGYNYTIHRSISRFKNSDEDLSYIVGVAETIDNAFDFCNDYKKTNPDAELEIKRLI
jgi:hypothetical protein